MDSNAPDRERGISAARADLLAWLSDRAKLALTAVACVVVLGGGGLWFLGWDLARCYEMSPWGFRKQAESIQRGMTEEEAVEKVKGYSEIRREKGKTVLIMKAQREPLILPGIWQGITLELDMNGKVTKVYSWDG